MRQTFILDRSAFDARRSATPVVENAKNGVVRPLLDITKHGYGDEAYETTSCALPTFAPPCEGLFYCCAKGGRLDIPINMARKRLDGSH